MRVAWYWTMLRLNIYLIRFCASNAGLLDILPVRNTRKQVQISAELWSTIEAAGFGASNFIYGAPELGPLFAPHTLLLWKRSKPPSRSGGNHMLMASYAYRQ